MNTAQLRFSKPPRMALAVAISMAVMGTLAPAPARAKKMAVASVTATGPETVLIEFSGPVPPTSLRADNFRIAGLSVVKAVPADEDRRSVLLFTSPQKDEPYLLKIRKRGGFKKLRRRARSFQGVLPLDPIIPPVPDGTPPLVVGAGATSNTTVVVTFNEAMGDSALRAVNYSILELPADGQGGVLRAIRARFTDESRTAVELTTLSQSEVDYEITANDVRDEAGNQIEPRRATPPILVDPRRATFHGIPPAFAGTDADGDGLSDDVEQLGWTVTVKRANGTTFSRAVTSDPNSPDTDADLLTDDVEHALGTNPRRRDTDGDGLSDNDEYNVVYSDTNTVDTDEDGLTDNLEYDFFKTSPIFADTDGDQLTDPSEISSGFRNPLVADLPTPRIQIGNVNLTLDLRFDFTDAQGMSKTTEGEAKATLTQHEEKKFATSNEEVNKTTTNVGLTTGVEVGFPEGGNFKAEVSLKVGVERGHTSKFDTESMKSAENAFEKSLRLTETADLTKSVTRRIEEAAMLVDVTLENLGDTAFTISDFELTAFAPDPVTRRKMVPIASLVPQNENLTSVNLGVLGGVSERGPFVFKAVEIFPQQVDELMKSPRGLVVQLSNYEITDEAGRNFAFTSQEVYDKTAGISIDFGDGRLETYRIATASSFDAFGRGAGITMRRALDEILGIPFEPTIRDGGDGIVSVDLAGDDLGVYAESETIIPGAILVRPGRNGVFETTLAGDEVVVDADYATTVTTRAGRQVEILTRVRDVETGLVDADAGDAIDDRRKFWVVLSSERLSPTVGFNDLVLRGGDSYALVFTEDLDNDKIDAREEYLYGSSDRDPNTDGCPAADPKDCQAGTYDTLTDFEEIKEGWTVSVAGTLTRRVYANPISQDSDGDRLLDHEEKACALDPRLLDTDGDGLTDHEEIVGFQVVDRAGFILAEVSPYAGTVVLDGGNGIAEVTRVGDDVLVPPGPSPAPGRILVLPGLDGVINSTRSGDDIIGALHRSSGACMPADATVAGFATDPLNPDTDADGISDGVERTLGIHPNNSFDGGFYRDTDQDGVPDAVEERGIAVPYNGGVLYYYSNKFDPDSDDDRLPDLLEHYLQSDPQSRDTDNDGLLDFDEFKRGDTCVDADENGGCQKFSARQPQSWGAFQEACLRAERCDFPDDLLEKFGSRQYGTNLNRQDTDQDGLTDKDEIAGYLVNVNGSSYRVQPDPFRANSDEDGWNDGKEKTEVTDATKRDSDADGTDDDDEGAICASPGWCRNPRQADRRIEQKYVQLSVFGDCDLLGDDGEISWSLSYRRDVDEKWYAVENGGRDVDDDLDLDVNKSVVQIIPFGRVVQFAGWLHELDGDSTDASLSWAPDPCADCGWIGSIDNTHDTHFVVDASLGNKSMKWQESGKCGNLNEQSYDWWVSATLKVD